MNRPQLRSDPELGRLIDDLRGARLAPGIAVGVAIGDESIVNTAGVGDVSTGAPVHADTLFMIGSVTKLFTATAMMVLAERGLISLDDPVAQHLPQLRLTDPTALADLRVWHLLSHVAGWSGDLSTDTGWGDDALARAVEELLPTAPQLAAPGTTAFYNNAALLVSGLLIEQVGRYTYERFVTSEILQPLGMNNSFFHPWQIANRDHAVGHRRVGNGQLAFRDWPLPRCFAPTGGLSSSITDLLHFARFHLDGFAQGRAPLSDLTRERMRARRAELEGALGVGIGWHIRPHGELNVYAHGGNVSGMQIADLAIVPNRRFAVTVLTNGPDGREVCDRVFDWCTERFLDLPRPEPIAAAAVPFREYVGRYRSGSWVMDAQVCDANRLGIAMQILDPHGAVVDSDPAVTVRVGANDVLTTDTRPWFPVGQFLRDADGPVQALRWNMRLADKLA